jgi:hypothetical protein
MSVVKNIRWRHVKKADTRSELREDDDEGAHQAIPQQWHFTT